MTFVFSIESASVRVSSLFSFNITVLFLATFTLLTNSYLVFKLLIFIKIYRLNISFMYKIYCLCIFYYLRRLNYLVKFNFAITLSFSSCDS